MVLTKLVRTPEYCSGARTRVSKSCCVLCCKHGTAQQSLRLKEAAALLQLQQQKVQQAATSSTTSSSDGSSSESDMPVVTSPPRSQRQQAVLDLIGHCVSALQQGVKRTHLVPPVDGGLIEVCNYTRASHDPHCSAEMTPILKYSS
jgi:hypothetical protein